MNKLDSTQLEQLKAIGAYLYEVRLAQSRTLEEIAAKTYIPLRLLRALEAGQDQTLPEPVFVQGFIRRYADALGLDGLELAQEFPVQSATQPEVETAYFDNSLAELGPTSDSETALPKGFSMRRSQRSPMPFLTTGAIALFILGGLLYLLSQIGSRPANVSEQDVAEQNVAEQDGSASSESTASEVEPAAVSPTPDPVASTSPVASSSPQASPSVSPSVSASASPTAPRPSASPSPTTNAPVTVEVSLTADSWLEVTVDGEVEISETLPRGTKRSWSGEQAVTIVAGNAGGVQVAFNKAKAVTMGNLGAVAERTFTPGNSPSQP